MMDGYFLSQWLNALGFGMASLFLNCMFAACFVTSNISLGLSPLPVTVNTTDSSIIFLVGDPELNLHLPLLL